MSRPLRVLAVPTLLVVLAACSSGTPDVEVGPAQAAEPVAGSSQIVLELHNEGDGDDRLVEVTSPAAIGVEIHRTQIEDQRATMTELDGIELPAGETVRFRPGDLHLMLVVPDETVVVGGTFDLVLDFEHSEDRTIPVEVVDLLDLAESEEDLELLAPDGATDPDGADTDADPTDDASDNDDPGADS